MDEHPHPLEPASLPARDHTESRLAERAPTPLNHVTGAELTSSDLDRTLAALRSLDR